MTRQLILALMAVLTGTFLLPQRATAGDNVNARILIHLQFPTTKNACDRADAAPACSDLVTEGQLDPTRYFAYVLVGNASPIAGVGGVEFGIAYEAAPHSGVDILEWRLCADSEFPSAGWPAAGSGNRVTWDTSLAGHCQFGVPPNGNGVTAVAGYFYCAAYTPDFLRVTANPASQEAAVTDCAGVTDQLYDPTTCNPMRSLGSAAFGGGMGYNPCGPWTPIAYDCGNIGPTTVTAGTAGVVYGDPYALACLWQGWSVMGNAVLVGPTDQRLVTVNVGAAGQFTLSHYCAYDIDAGSSCCKIVQVLDPVVAQPSTWSSIKAMYR